ncbi:flagellar hook-basal body complex protein FliE [Arsenophonus nasoniae]|uniref:flagellar hook-basal body complex protein FliE n=1 Tax=Arsenophonus nasoniae TaxID=638 RepID=UPI003879186B
MSIPAIQSVIAQMTTDMVSKNSIPLTATAQSGFASHLINAVGKINQTRVTASQKAQALTLEKSGVELNDVMVDLQKASLSLQFGIQVRNKLVGAYQEIMNMPV